ncbi:MAG: NAD(P)/FAD-dependent oxidoreductase, partial [Blastopirellula sp. JB062]
MDRQQAVIIGAGPAGLTAAYELLTRTQIKPIVLEMSDMVGGISRTVNYKGNRIDIGGHRFFSKSDRVMDWWVNMLPIEAGAKASFTIKYQNQTRNVEHDGGQADPDQIDDVMLVRPRKSRIYFLRKFFDYPISLSATTIANLGPIRMAKIGTSYLQARLFPIRNEQNLEQFFINRFGRELYLTFFKSYTEKVWGVPCDQISAAWGAQRIKGLSITKAIMHAVKKPFQKKDVSQKGVETSLIEQFLYPKHGPGQMWETCAKRVVELGGELHYRTKVDQLHLEGEKIVGVTVVDEHGERRRIDGDYVFSTMPVNELIRSIDREVPANVKEVSEGLQFRDFITVGMLVNKLKIKEDSPQGEQLVRDNWIYIQERDVLIGRLQIFNNWSKYLVADPNTVWLGLEYFCYENDDLWKKSDEEMAALGKTELAKIDIIDENEVLDATVIRVPKTYPAY